MLLISVQVCLWLEVFLLRVCLEVFLFRVCLEASLFKVCQWLQVHLHLFQGQGLMQLAQHHRFRLYEVKVACHHPSLGTQTEEMETKEDLRCLLGLTVVARKIAEDLKFLLDLPAKVLLTVTHKLTIDADKELKLHDLSHQETGHHQGRQWVLAILARLILMMLADTLGPMRLGWRCLMALTISQLWRHLQRPRSRGSKQRQKRERWCREEAGSGKQVSRCCLSGPETSAWFRWAWTNSGVGFELVIVLVVIT